MDNPIGGNIIDLVSDTIKKMTGFMELECQVEIKEADKEADKDSQALLVSIYTPEDARFLIGKNGQNLKAFEHLLRAMFLKRAKEVSNIVLDVNDYRKSKASFVVDLARQAVTRVRSTQKACLLYTSPSPRD